ncbi:2-succinyl-6-hydroxy-2,4-cyclohexadiene-1-carboxylate synthase [Jeotgalibacillus salarius]|uniref:Putative 2-succinyl-6-hydroxy-2,4-cyclohexadiene-1-carboxylate synthase n=1 Tax=Jeotgalibacillus salarius TaxID=546023 RepID=A0A4Y8LB30_9BACL|nr:2-succinyl-6-hydroxy-2,4-cyclohexadiene-1-carboxylate synthase [Jeotgalibacillus salarius]TFD98240.1 2-succinyl-6-hydroxy-2,4-cyclohexadiene-1-carboxylate synthase [Jeotgalibacillus salarius]
MDIQVKEAHYNVQITGKGSPLVLLHGFTGSTATWKRFADCFKNDHQLIAIDLPGHGLTSAPLNEHYFLMENVCEAIQDILDQLNIDQAAFLGYSMGGRTALAFSVLYPEYVNSLILESASPGLKTTAERVDRKTRDEKLATFIENEGLERFTDKWEEIPLFESQKKLSPEQRMEIRSERLRNTTEGLSASLRYMGTGSQPSYWSMLDVIGIPVLLITGEWDRKFIDIAKKMKKLFKNAEHQIILQAGHAIQVEQPEKFDTMVREFLVKNSTT